MLTCHSLYRVEVKVDYILPVIIEDVKRRKVAFLFSM